MEIKKEQICVLIKSNNEIKEIKYENLNEELGTKMENGYILGLFGKDQYEDDKIN